MQLLETLRWENGYRHLDAHLERLSGSAQELGIPVCFERVHRELLEACSPWSGPMRVRLLVDAHGVRVQASPLDPLPEPYLVGLSAAPVHSNDPTLRHKLHPRTLYDQARASCPGCHDAILWNERWELTESCIANLVVESGGKLWTPPIDCGLLPGVGRRMLLESRQVAERVLPIEDLQRCDALWLVNSVRGLWRAHLLQPTLTDHPGTR